MPFDYDALEASRRQDLSRLVPPGPPRRAPEDDSLGFFSAAGDVLVAPFRGIVGAGQGILGLADVLSFDLIPDRLYTSNPLGPSETIVGGLLEGVTQFSVGFIPGLAAAKGISALSKLGTLERAAQFTVAGAVADFAVFQGNEQRLSNVIEAVPVLRNPITAFLSAEEDDGQLEGRLKNVLEGAAIGAVSDGLLKAISFGVRRVKAARSIREARPNATAEEIARAVDERVPLTPEVQAAQDAVLVPPDDPLLRFRGRDDDPETIARLVAADEAGVKTILDAFHGREESSLFPVAGGTFPNKVNPRNLTPRERLAAGLKETDINLDHFQGGEGMFQLWRAVEGLTRKQARLAPGVAPRSFEEQRLSALKAVEAVMGPGPATEQTFARMAAEARQVGQDLVDVHAKADALTIVAQKYAAYSADLTKAITEGKADDRAYAKFAQNMGTFADFLNVVRGTRSERGRGLGFLRSTVDLLDPEELQGVIQEFGGRGRVKELAERVQALFDKGGSPHEIVQFLEQHPKLAAAQEWWVGSMLSRVSTSAVDLTSALAFAAYRPFNSIVGGALTRNKEAVRLGVHQLTYMPSGFLDAMKAWSRAFKSKQNVLDAHALSRARDLGAGASPSSLSPARLGVDPGSAGGRVLSGMSYFTQTVFGVLKANEELVKTLTTHSYGKALILESAMKRGLAGAELNAAVESGFKELVRNGQLLSRRVLFSEGLDRIRERGGFTTGFQAVDEANKYADKVLSTPEMKQLSTIAESVRERGREVTFTRRGSEAELFGKASATINMIRNRHPLARFVFPFVNTPVNILQTGFQQIDAIGPVKYSLSKVFSESKFLGATTLETSKNRFVRQMLSADENEASDAVGRVFMGLGTMTTFGSLALAGTITGKGPEDPALRRQLRNAGWQPYSIRIGDKYVSYARVEPVATVISLAADAMQASKWLPPEDQGGVTQAVLAGALSVVNQATNKTFLKGLADFVDVIGQPERFAEEWVAGFVSTFAVPGAAQQFVPATDPHFREARGVVDRVLARVPGLSANVPAMRNVLGEPISNGSVFQDVAGFFGQRYTQVSDDAITRELAGLGGFYPPGARRLGVDLRDLPLGNATAYDRFAALHGQVKVGGRTLRRALNETIKSAQYQRLPTEGTDFEDSPRRAVVKSVLARYRRAAWYQLLEETPELEARRQQQVLDRRTLFAGRAGDFSTDPEGFLNR